MLNFILQKLKMTVRGPGIFATFTGWELSAMLSRAIALANQLILDDARRHRPQSLKAFLKPSERDWYCSFCRHIRLDSIPLNESGVLLADRLTTTVTFVPWKNCEYL